MSEKNCVYRSEGKKSVWKIDAEKKKKNETRKREGDFCMKIDNFPRGTLIFRK